MSRVAPKNILARFQAPPWDPPRSEYVVLWHGTQTVALRAIETAIDLKRCAVDTDFGRGFYATTLERQARLWAWDQFYRWQAKNPTATGVQPVVLRFRFRRHSTDPVRSDRDRGLDSLNFLDFIRGEYDNEDYWSLVQHCRSSQPAGPGGTPPENVHNHKRPPGGWYDVVSGPVAAFWDQRVAMADADQYSFHTDTAIAILQDLIATGKGRGALGQGDPDYYRWEVVA